jgi:ubiquinone/menaquinone biosynthesis C-methylase UbiE
MNEAAAGKTLVREGYDVISEAYRADTFALGGSAYARAIEAVERRVPPGARVLDLGCGCGVPVARRLAARYDVTGVDFSARKVARARSLVPSATFVQADITSVDLPRAAFDAVVSFFVIIHVPLEEQPALFDAVARWIMPGGTFCATVGQEAWTGTEDDWYGAPMYWSHGDRETYASWLTGRGFRIDQEWAVPEGDGGQAALLATSLTRVGERR